MDTTAARSDGVRTGPATPDRAPTQKKKITLSAYKRKAQARAAGMSSPKASQASDATNDNPNPNRESMPDADKPPAAQDGMAHNSRKDDSAQLPNADKPAPSQEPATNGDHKDEGVQLPNLAKPGLSQDTPTGDSKKR